MLVSMHTCGPFSTFDESFLGKSALIVLHLPASGYAVVRADVWLEYYSPLFSEKLSRAI